MIVTLKKIKQHYVPYWEWEDWINGMWRKLPKEKEAEFLYEAIIFTSNYIDYGNAMKDVIKAWPRTMLNSLTNPSINKRAFLGHCACSYKINCPEYIVRIAWKELTDNQRILADEVAQETINKWIYEFSSKN